MKATKVGKSIPGKFSFTDYIRAKYVGLFPENFPTRKELEQLERKGAYRLLKKKKRIVKTVSSEWIRQQR